VSKVYPFSILQGYKIGTKFFTSPRSPCELHRFDADDRARVKYKNLNECQRCRPPSRINAHPWILAVPLRMPWRIPPKLSHDRTS
jgi:hypothetical protein